MSKLLRLVAGGLFGAAALHLRARMGTSGLAAKLGLSSRASASHESRVTSHNRHIPERRHVDRARQKEERNQID